MSKIKLEYNKSGQFTEKSRQIIIKEIKEGKTASEILEKYDTYHKTLWRIAKSEGLQLGKSTVKSKNLKSTPKQAQAVARQKVDLDHWQRRARSAEKRLAHEQVKNEKIIGLSQQKIRVPSFILPRTSGSNKKLVHSLFSDLHYGDVVQPSQVENYNEYNVDVAERRFWQYISGIKSRGCDMLGGSDPEGLVFWSLGDIVSGDIHDELKIHNELTSNEQVIGAASLVIAGLKELLHVYPKIQVFGTPGNHGRKTRKPQAKSAAADNYDTLVMEFVRREFKSENKINVVTPPSGDVSVNLLGLGFLGTHGDKIGSRGGTGFIGPVANIAKGGQKLSTQSFKIGKPIDVVLHGHFHRSYAQPNIISNGCFTGLDEYAYQSRFEPSLAEQTIFVQEERYKAITSLTWLRLSEAYNQG